MLGLQHFAFFDVLLVETVPLSRVHPFAVLYKGDVAGVVVTPKKSIALVLPLRDVLSERCSSVSLETITSRPIFFFPPEFLCLVDSFLDHQHT